MIDGLWKNLGFIVCFGYHNNTVNNAVWQASGVTVQQDCIVTFNDLKLGHKFRYIVYSLTDNLEQIRVLKTAPPSTLLTAWFNKLLVDVQILVILLLLLLYV